MKTNGSGGGQQFGKSRGNNTVLQHSVLMLTENINLTKMKAVARVLCLSHLHEDTQEA